MSTPDEQLRAPLVKVAPHPELVASIVVPAKNEAELLPAALAGLAAQRGLPSHCFEVIVLINNSNDGSVEIARQFARENLGLTLHIASHDFPQADANIGSVRRYLMDEACRRLNSCSSPLKVILSTDADSVAAPDWIAQNVREIRHGAAAVGGAIHFHPHDRAALPRKVAEMQHKDDQYRLLAAWLEDRLDPLPHDPWPRHQHHFGASLALTVAAYQTIGGLPSQKHLEDVALYHALLRHDLPFRHSPQVQVCTSARLNGRVSVGLSEQLGKWQQSDAGGMQTQVDSVEYLVHLFSARQEFRQLWQAQHSRRSSHFDYALERFCRHNRLTRQNLADVLQAPFFGEAWHRLDLGPGLRSMLAARDTQPLTSAVAELQALQNPSPARNLASRSRRKDPADRIPA